MLNEEIIEQTRLVSDESLILQIRSGDADAFSALIYRYEDFLNFKVNRFNPDAAQYDDYKQEAILSFYTAVSTFDEGKSSFRTYLNVCVTRTLISLDRKFKRHKATETPIEDDVEALVDDEMFDPQNMIEDQERVIALVEDIKRLLSEFELKALTLYLSGNSYDSIAKYLGTTAKSVDNALQRVRLKLKSRS